jgi:hypothetical protein
MKGRGDERLAVYVAGGRAWSCYKYRGLSLCRRALLCGLALRMGALAAGFLFLPGADGSGALVRPGVAGPWRSVWYSLTQLRWGRGRCTRVMGACCAACLQRRCNHLLHNYDGVVGERCILMCGFSERRRGHLVGRIGPRGGMG